MLQFQVHPFIVLIVCKSMKSDHMHPILQTGMAISNTLHSIQSFKYLLQFHLLHTPSVCVCLISFNPTSQTITICIRHPYFFLNTRKHLAKDRFVTRVRLFGTVFPFGTGCLKHSALKTHIFNNFLS